MSEAGSITGEWMEEGRGLAEETESRDDSQVQAVGLRHEGSCWLRELPAEGEAPAAPGSSRATRPRAQSTAASARSPCHTGCGPTSASQSSASNGQSLVHVKT